MINSISQSFIAYKLPLTDAGRTVFPAIRERDSHPPPEPAHPCRPQARTRRRTSSKPVTIRAMSRRTRGPSSKTGTRKDGKRLSQRRPPAPAALLGRACVLTPLHLGPTVVRGSGYTRGFPESVTAAVAQGFPAQRRKQPEYQKLSAYSMLILSAKRTALRLLHTCSQ